jgi:large subunit ribosomal protein L18
MNSKEILRKKRHARIRMKVRGNAEKPRLVIKRGISNFTAQIIDDVKNVTIFSLSTADKAVRAKFATAGNVKTAETFGEMFASKAKEKGITQVVFDRAGYLYHGRVKAFADAARKGGLVF